MIGLMKLCSVIAIGTFIYGIWQDSMPIWLHIVVTAWMFASIVFLLAL